MGEPRHPNTQDQLLQSGENPNPNARGRNSHSFIKTLKREEIYANQYTDLEDLRANIEDFIERYYNRQRLHSALSYCPRKNSRAKPKVRPKIEAQRLEASGTPRLGGKLRFRVKAMDGSTRQFSFTGTVVEFELERKLVWTGGMFPILVGRHFFEFVPMRDGKTQVIQGEEFRGLYPLFAGRKKMLALRPAYERFNQELAARAAHRHE